MNVQEIIKKAWELIIDFKIKNFGREEPSFFVIHPATLTALVKNYQSSIHNTFEAYYPPYIAGDYHRLFGIKIVVSSSIQEDEILIGITPLKLKG